MNPWLIRCILLFLFHLCPCALTSIEPVIQAITVPETTFLDTLNTNNDHGLWLEQNIDFKLGLGWSLELKTEQRFGADYRKFWYQEYSFIFSYQLIDKLHLPSHSFLKSFTVCPGYIRVRQLKKDTLGVYHWISVNRPLIESNVRCEIDKWTINQRLRGEYYEHLRRHYKNYGLCRYRLAVYTPWKWTRWNFNPYVSNEWFFRDNTYSKNHPNGLVGIWYENRFRAGIEFQLLGQLASAVYWQWKRDKQKPETRPEWFNTYQWGLALGLNF